MPLPVPHPWLTEPAPSLLYLTPPGVIPDDALFGCIAALEAAAKAATAPYACVVVADALLQMSARQRQAFAEAERRMQAADRLFCAGTAYVLTSAVTRGLVTAVYWLTPPVYPYAFFAKTDEAHRWAKDQLDAARARARPSR